MTSSDEGQGRDAATRLADDWRTRLASTDPAGIALTRNLANLAETFADRFYAVLLDDPRANRFLSQDQVRQRLHPGLQRWLRGLLLAGQDDVDALVAANRHVGVVHARIGMPVDLVGRGARVLRIEMIAELGRSGAPSASIVAAIACVDACLDIALECMTFAYADAQERSVRTDAAYRLFSLAQNIGTERERQRALLLGWENDLLYAFATGSPLPGPLAGSEFGLWLLHKGIQIIGDNGETRHIRSLVDGIDEQLVGGDTDTVLPAGTFADIRQSLATIHQLLSLLFGRIGELEAGSDTLTQLLNRRFLATVMRHEIELASSHGQTFSVVLVDIDHFKDINDRHGHDTGDRALQFLAALLTESVRSSDYLFRLGGEEFLIVLVAADTGQAARMADALRQRVQAHPLILDSGDQIPMTVSMGIAGFNGHPDYERLLARADEALYAAKHAGRNRIELAA